MREVTKVLPVLRNKGFPLEVIKSISKINSEKQAREFFSEKEIRLYFFRYHFGLGKTTYGLMNLTCGDIFIAETHLQLKEALKDFADLRHEDCKRIVSWDIFIGYNYSLDKNGNRRLEPPSDEQIEKCPEEIRQLWDREPHLLQKMRKVTNRALNQGEKRREARNKIKHDLFQNDKESELMDRFGKQFSRDFWENNVVFATTKRISEIKEKAWLDETDIIAVDEGAEDEKSVKLPDIEIVHSILCKNTHSINPPNSNQTREKKVERLQREYGELFQPNSSSKKIPEKEDEWLKINSNIDIPPIPDDAPISEEELEQLIELSRKMFIHLYRELTSNTNEKWGNGLGKHGRHLTGKSSFGYNVFGELFEPRYKHIFKKKFDGQTLAQLTIINILKDDNISESVKLRRIKKLNKIFDTLEPLWEFRNCLVDYQRDSNSLNVSIEVQKPRMFDLWDISLDENNQTEIWVLDATCGKDYIENKLIEPFRYYRLNQSGSIDYQEDAWALDWAVNDVPSLFLGDGNPVDCKSLPDFVTENRDYNSLDTDVLEPNYRRFAYKYNQEGSKQSIPRKALYDTDTKELTPLGKEFVRMIKEERNKGKKVGVIIYKTVAEHINQQVKPFKDKQGNKIDVAKWFEISEGTNDFKNVQNLYSVGKPYPDKEVILQDYISQYREVPDLNPFEFPSMRETKANSLTDFNDEVDEVELVLKDRMEIKSSLGKRRTQTHWEDWFNRNIENPVFDTYFRMRNQMKNQKKDREINRVGTDANNFIGEAEGSFQDLIDEKVTDQTLIMEWENVKAKGIYEDRCFVNNAQELKKVFKIWKKAVNGNIQKNQIPSSTLNRYKKKWNEKGLENPF